MSRTLRILFRREPVRDRVEEGVRYEGYDFVWPDGRLVAIGLTAFCKHGQRLLGLGRHLAGAPERLVDLLLFPLADREAALTRLPGHRVRRFSLERCGRQGRLYFFDGTPTTVTFDLAARPAEDSAPTPQTSSSTFGVPALPHDALS